MKNKLAILSLSIILLLLFTRGINIHHMIESNNEGDSYADISAFIYVFAGLGLIFIAWKTVGLSLMNPLAIIPYGLGISGLIYGLFLLKLKGFI